MILRPLRPRKRLTRENAKFARRSTMPVRFVGACMLAGRDCADEAYWHRQGLVKLLRVIFR